MSSTSSSEQQSTGQDKAEEGTLVNTSFILFPLGAVKFDRIRQPVALDVAALSLAYFDRTQFITLLRTRTTHSFVRILRPKRFGKSLFLSTLELFHDCSVPQERFDDLFKVREPISLVFCFSCQLCMFFLKGTAVMRDVQAGTIRPGQFMILDLDFSGVANQDVATMHAKLHKHVNGQIRAVWEKYAAHLGKPVVGPAPATAVAIDESDCITSLENLVGRVKTTWSSSKPWAVRPLVSTIQRHRLSC